ncbi:MAG: NmrA family NAD(P)-binding protein [Verrucomicrobiota bacterium]
MKQTRKVKSQTTKEAMTVSIENKQETGSTKGKSKPNILVIGATGKVGGEVVRLLQQEEGIHVIAAVRHPDKASPFEEQGIETRIVDLDDVNTLPAVLKGVDRALLLTGYSVDMLKQSKRFLDEAKRQEVDHIVHIGASGAPTAEVAHWGWHQMVEAYIEQKGFRYTHLRPEAYMQNVTGPGYRWLNDDVITHYIGSATWSWVDCLDVAAMAAQALLKPETFDGKTIPLGYDSQTMDGVAAILSRKLGRTITAQADSPDHFYQAAVESGADPAYMHCVYTQFKLDSEGKIPGAGTVFNNFEELVGRPPITWEAFAAREAEHI